MRCLVSNDQIVLQNIIAQIDLLCGWPNGQTITATTVQWSDKALCYWCSLEDIRILSVLSNVQLNGLTVQDLDISHFVETSINP